MPEDVKVTRYPVISHGAEFLVMGLLMRRNILTYKAPPGNEGYDLICIHPDPRKSGPQIRVQVKSRLATDCDRGFPVKKGTLDAFDFLVVAFMNVGHFFRKRHGKPAKLGRREPEFFTFPREWIKKHHNSSSTWEKVQTRGQDIAAYKGDLGFELIASKLGIPYPDKVHSKTTGLSSELEKVPIGNTAEDETATGSGGSGQGE